MTGGSRAGMSRLRCRRRNHTRRSKSTGHWGAIAVSILQPWMSELEKIYLCHGWHSRSVSVGRICAKALSVWFQYCKNFIIHTHHPQQAPISFHRSTPGEPIFARGWYSLFGPNSSRSICHYWVLLARFSVQSQQELTEQARMAPTPESTHCPAPPLLQLQYGSQKSKLLHHHAMRTDPSV
jgi:hypothetical protein